MDAYGETDPLPADVGDSAGVPQVTLNRCQQYGMDWISRMPGPYDLPETFIERAGETGDGTTIRTLSERKEAAVYRQQAFGEILYGESYRFVVVHSSMLNRRNKRAIDNKLDRTEQTLQDELNEREG